MATGRADRSAWRELSVRATPSVGTRQARREIRRFAESWSADLPFDDAEKAVLGRTLCRAANSVRDAKAFANVLRLLAVYRLAHGQPVTQRDFISAASIKEFSDDGAAVLGHAESSMRHYVPILKRVQRGLCSACSRNRFLRGLSGGVGRVA
jgi:hypothetical protein